MKVQEVDTVIPSIGNMIEKKEAWPTCLHLAHQFQCSINVYAIHLAYSLLFLLLHHFSILYICECRLSGFVIPDLLPLQVHPYIFIYTYGDQNYTQQVQDLFTIVFQ